MSLQSWANFFCRYAKITLIFRFEPLPSQRVELHLYRVLGLGAYSSQQVDKTMFNSIILVTILIVIITIMIILNLCRTGVWEGVCSLWQGKSPSFRSSSIIRMIRMMKKMMITMMMIWCIALKWFALLQLCSAYYANTTSAAWHSRLLQRDLNYCNLLLPWNNHGNGDMKPPS